MSDLAPGARVRVRDHWPERGGPVHIRTPHYVRGVEGRVVRRLGAFANPEDLAFGRPAAVMPLYHVAFEAPAIWPEAAPATLLVEIFDHWLEPLP
jgi:nitrile hydratase